MKAAPLLIGSVIGSFAAVWIILHPLHPEDRISIVQGVCLMGLGFIFFISMFDLSNYFMFYTYEGKKFAKKYKLSLYDVMDISNKVVSAVQAVLSSICGTIVCTFSCPRNMLRTSHFMSQAYAWFGASYFLYDVYSMFMIHNLSPKTINRLNARSLTKENEIVDDNQILKASHFTKVKDFIYHQPIIIIHHLFIGLFGFLVVVHLRKNFGDCVFGLIFLMELSTPFVSFRGILSRLHLKECNLYLVNGIVMIAVFFMCRIFLFIWLFKLFYLFQLFAE
ncbi:protein FAM57B, putative [Pediculus humanus corporis]|uniref:Protein FAM57B, putative n=1 Tax=Pediculus humanus subsp. corporis TaxID=121224 RepID=E0VUB8_PEDHC|nr:protein FAM57B, putative [Pediculus humanus corporis]EEB16974.1 protein FAM57B, putative [Pediculus humanus corporis]